MRDRRKMRAALQIQIAVLGCRGIQRLFVEFCRRLSMQICPATGNRQAAFRAMAILQTILLHVMPGTLNQQRLTRWARSMRPIAENIAFVNVMQPRI